jgi:hypothetical protein
VNGAPAIVREEPRYQPVGPGLEVWNLDGLSWFEAPAPLLGHDHFAQSVGWVNVLDLIYRCPCGEVRYATLGHRWFLPDNSTHRVAPGLKPLGDVETLMALIQDCETFTEKVSGPTPAQRPTWLQKLVRRFRRG